MMAIIVAPEVGVAMATRDFLFARMELAEAKEGSQQQTTYAAESNPAVANGLNNIGGIELKHLTISHAFVANMGGFRLKVWNRYLHQPSVTTEEGDEVNNADSTMPNQPQEMVRVYEGIVLDYSGLVRIPKGYTHYHIPDEEDVRALSKRDSFTKLFAILQSSWLIMQCIARASLGLPITQLELATNAFIVCGVMVYGLWWNKPYGVERREPVLALGNPTYMYGLGKEERSPRESEARLNQERVPQPSLAELLGIEDTVYMKAILDCLRGIRQSSALTLIAAGQLAFYVSGILFSAFHILAWNWEFPNWQTKIALRVFAVSATSSTPLMMFCLFVIMGLDTEHVSGAISELLGAAILASMSAIVLASMIVYVTARLGLIILIFYCFSSMPVEWTKIFPHFG